MEPTTATTEQTSPLALTDDELGKIFKAIAATGIRGGVTVESRTMRPNEKGKGKSPMLYSVVAPSTRAVSSGGEIAQTRTRLEADVLALAFNNLAFLVESLQAERAAHDKLREEIRCVEDVLDARNVPTEMAPGVPYTLHGRVGAGIPRPNALGDDDV